MHGMTPAQVLARLPEKDERYKQGEAGLKAISQHACQERLDTGLGDFQALVDGQLLSIEFPLFLNEPLNPCVHTMLCGRSGCGGFSCWWKRSSWSSVIRRRLYMIAFQITLPQRRDNVKKPD